MVSYPADGYASGRHSSVPLQNYDLVARPQGSVQNKVDLAVDSLCTIGPGANAARAHVAPC